MKKGTLLLTGFLLIGLLAIACTPVSVDVDALRTQVAATIYAELTPRPEAVTETLPAVPPTLGATEVSTLIPTATSSRLPTPTPMTPSDTPTSTLEPMVTPTATLCLPSASFEEDVTVPDGTSLMPSETFTKTWRFRSDGCAPWPAGATFVFDSGDQMGAAKGVPVPDTPLGDTVDISVEMVAPDAPGTYKGYWQMQSPGGDRLGSRVFVEIVVPSPTPAP